jgi:hypothetical protein
VEKPAISIIISQNGSHLVWLFDLAEQNRTHVSGIINKGVFNADGDF